MNKKTGLMDLSFFMYDFFRHEKYKGSQFFFF